ncbi:hypothetical protein HRG_005027 [Hirsutella rhossiliensis]|uniref:Uncharacterized protein n=1 Tax=Hirsutella rhossiliensis TaxID=111463 RepID=A0A9P8N0I7_9HYPO|nr:uncharacterized protein HRG_05027 [Hirsutella rhossiliensis]KAH0964599.1 hypothetical protein HRG_05027 [Hirsutella rhossiliensis]
MRVNRLSLSDLSRFGRGNDRLSYLRSSSTVSSTQQAEGDTSHQEAMDEATAAISGWQDEPRPLQRPAYNQYELADSSEVLPSDSLSQRLSPTPLEFEPLAPAIDSRTSPSDVSESTLNSLQRLKNQYDGPADSQRLKGSEPTSLPPLRPNKRSASQFSLRSLTRSFSKRPRLQGLRKLATHVYRGGSRHLSLARHRWRLQKEQERRQFEAWKAKRRRERPADPLKGKSERGFGTFSFERGRFGNEEWWKEGVAKYQAPGWMLFQK